MPVYVKSGSYTLTQSFVAGGGIYSKNDSSNIRLWSRLRAAAVDDSGNGLTVSYTGSPTISNQQIPSPVISRIPDLPVATFDGTSDNAAVAATPHLDFSGNVPFTISGWIDKPDDGLPGSIFDMPNVAALASGWSGLVTSTKSIAFVIKGTGGKITISTDTDVFIAGEWTHFAMTYDGSKLASGMSIYMNGEKLPVNETTAGAFTTIDANGSRSLKILANYNASARTAGSLSEFAIWGSELQPEAVRALYHSTAGRYYAKSGIVSLPNRIRLREEDSQFGRYPNQLRTTGKHGDLKGNAKIAFSDNKTQIFNPTSDAIYPLGNNRANIDNLDLSRIIASPNQNSNIITEATASSFLSTQGAKLALETGMVIKPFIESSIFLNDKSDSFYSSGTSDKDYPGYDSPLRDKIIIKIPINNSSEKFITRYCGTGLSNDTEGAFPNTFRSTGFYYYNFSLNSWEDIGLVDSYTMFYSGSSVSKINCVSLGSNILDSIKTFAPEGTSTGQGAGSLPKVQQFKMSDHTAVFVDSVADGYKTTRKDSPYTDLTSSLGYHLVGSPTQAGLAPWHHRYHATGSQTLSISEYLAGDFLLEKAVVDIPVIVQRSRGALAGDGTVAARFYESCRDIDNYMFFLYRQRRAVTGEIDRNHDVSLSRRTLICSGAASFFSSTAFSGRVPDAIRERGLPHTPAFSYDFQSPSGSHPGANPTPLVSSFTGSIRIEMKVAAGNAHPVGGSRFPLAGPYVGGLGASYRSAINVNSWHRSVVTQDWWQGGGDIPSASLVCESALNEKSIRPLTFRNHETYLAGLGPFAETGSMIDRASAERTGRSIISRNPRYLKSHRGSGEILNISYPSLAGELGQTSLTSSFDLGVLGYSDGVNGHPQTYPILFSSLPGSDVSPFLFRPGDELVLGIDAGIAMLPASGSAMTDLISANVDAGVDLGFYKGTSGLGVPGVTFGCMSGSFMKIMPGEASITLFGSQIRMNREVLATSNQCLTSDAIHESVGDARVHDQFDIGTRFDLSGSYVDRLIYGKLTSLADLNATNKIIVDLSMNRMNDDAILRTNRGTVSLFSKNRTGTQRTPTFTKSPDWDTNTGYPPAFAGADPLGFRHQNFWQYLRENNRDQNFITKFPASVLQSAKIVSLQRFVPHIDSREVYYDSMMPSISKFASSAESSTVPTLEKVTSDPTTGRSLSGVYNTGVKIWTGNMHRLTAYPYLGNPTRFKNQNFIAYLIPSSGSGASLSTAASRWQPVTSSVYEKLCNMTIFNRGFSYTQNYSTPTTSIDLVGYFFNSTGSYGPRYGILSPMIARPTARFRRDRYGQYRDMLEQRLDGKFFIEWNSTLAHEGEEPGSYLDDSPIQIRFVDKSDGSTIVSPFSTDSQNCSNEYTSSQPYTDQVASYSPSGSSESLILLDGTAVSFGMSSFGATFVPTTSTP